ncbi:hypothetical protein ACIGXI_22975 [Kitasatospora aureofaciens]|uniref:hypothetical protein n=1 Tax=Kitasatospora aureofaciens TaxID=1894 RepID=UPI0037CBFBE2
MKSDEADRATEGDPGDGKLDGYAVGAWMRRQRKAEALGADQAAKLDALDELWLLEPDWNRSYRRLLAYLAAGGALDGPANRTGLGDDPAFRPGAWLRKQATARTELASQLGLLAFREGLLAHRQEPPQALAGPHWL